MCMGNSNTGVNTATPSPVASNPAPAPSSTSTDKEPKFKVRGHHMSHGQQRLAFDRRQNKRKMKEMKNEIGALRSQARTNSQALRINQGSGSGLNT